MKLVAALAIVFACSGAHESKRDVNTPGRDPEALLDAAFINHAVSGPPSLPAIDPANATRVVPTHVAPVNPVDVEIGGVAYMRDCAIDVRPDPDLTGKRDPARASALLAEGDALQSAAAAARSDALASIATDSAPVANYIEMVVSMVDAYRRSLDAGPYDARATRGLALAYHLAYRKGCALAVLKRLALLEPEVTNGEAASAAIDEFAADPKAFAPYRIAALAAMGR